MNCPDCAVEWYGVMVGAALFSGERDCWMCGQPGKSGSYRGPEGQEFYAANAATLRFGPDDPAERAA